MRKIHTNDSVTLVHGAPNEFLPAGSVGTVQSIWWIPETTFEVEFRRPDTEEMIRVLLRENEIVPADEVQSPAQS